MPTEDTKGKSISLKLHRGDDGRLKTLKGVSPTLGIELEILPLTYGQSKSYDSFGQNMLGWTDEEKVRLINEHIVEVDGQEWEEITVEDLNENFDPWMVNDLVQSVAVYSGMGRLFEAPDDVVGKMAAELEEEETSA